MIDRPHQHQPLAALLLFAFMLCGTMGTHALPDDREQAIYIQSDRAERDERKGITVYTGDVEIDQGSLHISADRVTIRSADEQVSHLEASGTPARMQQKPAIDKEPVYARANTIRYDVDSEVLTLDGSASVTQEGAKMAGQQVIYYMREQRVQASAAGTSTGQTRVQTVFPPRKLKPAADATTPAAAAPTPQRDSPDGAP